MYYLWIDPWVRKLWYALINDDNDVIDAWILLQNKISNTREENFDRMVKIYDFFSELIHNYNIKVVWIEKLFFTSKNKANAEFVFWIRAVLSVLFIQKWIKIKEVSPIELKKYITWNSKANKELVQSFVMKIFWLADIPAYNDAADALALAYITTRLKNS